MGKTQDYQKSKKVKKMDNLNLQIFLMKINQK